MHTSTADQLWITESMFTEHHSFLLRSAQRMARSRNDAEDLVQETWISALRAQTSFERRSSVRTWLTAIMRRRAYDLRRRTRKSEPFDEAFSYDSATSESFEPLSRCQARMEAHRALSMAEQLSEREREAVLLCDVFEMERPEAAAQLGLGRAHLRVVLHRGRSRLQELLAG